MLAVATAPHGLVTILMDEVTLSQRLHTPPLPVAHALVEYRWQHIGLCPEFQSGTTVIQATSCRTLLVLESLEVVKRDFVRNYWISPFWDDIYKYPTMRFRF